MKVLFITIISFFILFSGCQNYKNSSVEDIEVLKAGFNHWSEAPVMDSDVRERGTDLELVIKNWPDEAEPKHIIFRKKKSFPAAISDTTDAGVKITARIIMRSAVMSETSETTGQTDRLVFIRLDGKTRFIEIEEWSRIEQNIE